MVKLKLDEADPVIHVKGARRSGQQLPRQRIAERALSEQPKTRRDEPDLIAALVRQPAVRGDAEEQRDREPDLDEQDTAGRRRRAP